MYSTTALVKNSKLSGKLIGTHQQLDQAARQILARHLPRGRYFPSSKEIIYFEGVRGPDGLKRKSPGQDEPSHMLTLDESLQPQDKDMKLLQVILDHRWNLMQALKKHDDLRAAFEAAWMAHYIADGLTPAHHYPLSDTKEELMTNKEFVKVFGEPVKGIMHGRNGLETARNNWLYWGAGGVMTKHVGFEYGIVIIAASLPRHALMPKIPKASFKHVDPEQAFLDALEKIAGLRMYERFRTEGWTTQLALETKKVLLPTIAKVIALLWFSAVEEAYHLTRPSNLRLRSTSKNKDKK